jgi:hypothetical protein
MDIDEFWFFLERSARETASPERRLRWLEDRLSRVSRADIVDFQANLDTARRPVDTYAMWGTAYQIMDGLCSGDGFWYFQPWLIGQGREWYEHAVRDPDNLADIPWVRALAGRRSREWSDAEWPEWEALAYVARRACSPQVLRIIRSASLHLGGEEVRRCVRRQGFDLDCQAEVTDP